MPVSTHPADNVEEASTRYLDSHCIDLIDEETIQIENSLSQPLLTPDALSTVIKYHLESGGRTPLSLELLKQSGLFIVSVFGVMFYYVPAKAYAESICADPEYERIPCNFFILNHLTGTMLVAGGILMTATNAFFDQINAEFIPSSLIDYLQYPLSYKRKLTQNVVIFTGSFIASIPFIILTLTNPIPGLPKGVVVLQSLIIGMTNTLLHLLPFKLVLKNHWYRAPFLPLEFLFRKIAHKFLSEEEKQEKKLHMQLNGDYQAIKQRMIDHLDLALSLLSIYGFNFSTCSYANNVAKNIGDIKASNGTPLQLITQLLNYFHHISPNQPVCLPSKFNSILRKLIYFPGASWVILACSGFWVGTFSEINRLTKDVVSGTVLSAPSIYCLGVLLAFFGGNALQNSYDYLTAWRYDSVKIPLEFKLYPKTSALLIMISIYLSFFSYAAGAQLIEDNFTGELEFLRPYLLEFMLKTAQTGLIFLGSTAMIDFVKSLLGKFEQYGHNEDVRVVAGIFESFRKMKNSIQLFKPRLLLSSLAKANEDQLKSIFNLQQEKDKEELKQILLRLKLTLKQKLVKAIASYEKNQGENDLIHGLLPLMDEHLDFSALETVIYDKLPESFSKICEEYLSVLKIIKRLEKLNFDPNELLDSAYMSTNDDAYESAESCETIPLIPKVKGNLVTRSHNPSGFYHSCPLSEDKETSDYFSIHEVSSSNYARI